MLAVFLYKFSSTVILLSSILHRVFSSVFTASVLTVNCASDLLPLNASLLISVNTEDLIVIVPKLLQDKKALLSILVMPVPIVTALSAEQFEKAYSPISVTLSGMVISVRFVQ